MDRKFLLPSRVATGWIVGAFAMSASAGFFQNL